MTALTGSAAGLADSADALITHADLWQSLGLELGQIPIEGAAASVEVASANLHHARAGLARAAVGLRLTAEVLQRHSVTLADLQERCDDATSLLTEARSRRDRAIDRRRSLECHLRDCERGGVPYAMLQPVHAAIEEQVAEERAASVAVESIAADLSKLEFDYDSLNEHTAAAVTALAAVGAGQHGGAGGVGASLATSAGLLAGLFSSTPTEAPASGEYVVGPPRRPDIPWDEDFVYGSASPGWRDYLSAAKWKAQAEGAGLVRADLDDGLAAYWHYWDNTGEPFAFDYEEAYAEDDGVRATIEAEIARAQAGADRLIAEQGAQFSITGGPNPSGTYPQTENWQKAIGGHQVWSSADIEVANGRATMTITVHAEDYYNFNRGQSDIASNASDDENGRFAEVGWAKGYPQSGSVTRTVSWTVGDPAPVIESAGEESRDRAGGTDRGFSEDRPDRW